MTGKREIQAKPVLVAVDGSPESENALRWAKDRSSQTGVDLRIITCYQHFYTTGVEGAVSWDHFESTKKVSEARAVEVIERVLGTTDVDHVVALGPVDKVVADHSKEASMVVLGTRSSYGLRGRLRASTTDRITGKVTCPVVSVPLDSDALMGAGL